MKSVVCHLANDGNNLVELLDVNDKAILNVNFNKQGKHYNVYMSSDSEVEKLRFNSEIVLGGSDTIKIT
jgi:hypothetical protein